MDLPFGARTEIDVPIPVIVPYTKVHEGTVLALQAQPSVAVEYREVDASYGYWRLLCELWERGTSFVLVEQDILPWPGAIAELWGCGSWCCMAYNYGGPTLIAAHGCTKFGGDLLTDSRKNIFAMNGDERHWTQLDTHVHNLLTRRGWARHVHDTPVLHMNRFGEEVWRKANGLPPLDEVTPLGDDGTDLDEPQDQAVSR